MEVLLKPKVKELRSCNSSLFYALLVEAGEMAFIRKLSDSSTVITGIKTIPELSDTARQMIGRAEKFKQLNYGWDSYNALTPFITAISNAKDFIRQCDRDNLPLYFVAPGRNGEVLVELKGSEGKAAEAYFNADGSSELLLFKDEECIYEGAFNYVKLLTFFA